MFNDQNFSGRNIVWLFEFGSLEFVCYLDFDVWNFNNKSPLGITKTSPSGAVSLQILLLPLLLFLNQEGVIR